MIVTCDFCGKQIERRHPCKHNFCSAAHRDLWFKNNTDFSAISRGHRAKHLTELNRKRNPYCSVAKGKKRNSKKTRLTAEEYIGRKLKSNEVVHHMNGEPTDNSYENLLVITDKQHRQLHMQIAIKRMEAECDADK